MINKILEIKDFAVFKDFEWDKQVVDDQGKPLCLKDINIFFGRNYSGKTTLSRIFRAFEEGRGLERYEGVSFKVEMAGGRSIGGNTLSSFPYPVRVFNEDFVKENLLFISNPEEGVMPFAVLGSNVEVEKEIQVLREQLGSSEEDCETGLYKELSDAAKAYQIASGDYSKLKKNLEEKLKHKALDRKVGIKYQSSVYGEQNYTIAKLENELKKVTPQHRLLDVQVDELKTSLKEEFKQIPSMAEAPFLSFKKVNERIKGIVERPIMPSGKIEELVHNAIANKWVEAGCKLHRGKKTCLFCGGPITEHRWAELESHYDEATKELRKESERAVAWIEAQIQAVRELYRISPENYYRQFRGEVEKINRDMDILRERFISVLDSILQQVKKKVEDIHSTPTYIDHTFDLSLLDVIYKRIKDLESEAVKYGDNLKQNQSKAREKLRLSEVARFKEEIGYAELVNDISMKEAAVREAERLKKEKEAAIRDKENEIKAKERLRLNEEEGAIKVNAILQNYFGHRFIELRAIPKQNEEGVYFDVFRGEQKAYNLSEGERNLVAFAYFIAKLDDVDTVSEKPIIWIDDPISSLDANHVFFIFSLIDQRVVANHRWTQLFISTHNLEFLRYLKRLHAQNKARQWLLVERLGDASVIRSMPKYMRDYVTEFNYLFHQIISAVKLQVQITMSCSIVLGTMLVSS